MGEGQVIRVGMFLPRGINDAPADRVQTALRRMEEAGLDHVGIADHVSFHTGWGQDALMDAATFAAMTKRMTIAIGVYLLPLRHPVPVARQLATFAQRFPGRLTFGVGIGGEDPHELEVCGVDPKTRGRRMDESLAILRPILAGGSVTFHGRFFDIERALIRPTPATPIPIVVGGRADAALRRAGRLGDGWLGIWSTAEKYAERIAVVRSEAARAGRQHEMTNNGLQLWCGFGDSRGKARAMVAAGVEGLYRQPFERFERYSPYGTPAEIAAFLRPYIQAGCTTFNIAAQSEHWEEAVEGMAEVRRLVQPRVSDS